VLAFLHVLMVKPSRRQFTSHDKEFKFMPLVNQLITSHAFTNCKISLVQIFIFGRGGESKFLKMLQRPNLRINLNSL